MEGRNREIEKRMEGAVIVLKSWKKRVEELGGAGGDERDLKEGRRVEGGNRRG